MIPRTAIKEGHRTHTFPQPLAQPVLTEGHVTREWGRPGPKRSGRGRGGRRAGSLHLSSPGTKPGLVHAPLPRSTVGPWLSSLSWRCWVASSPPTPDPRRACPPENASCLGSGQQIKNPSALALSSLHHPAPRGGRPQHLESSSPSVPLAGRICLGHLHLGFLKQISFPLLSPAAGLSSTAQSEACFPGATEPCSMQQPTRV